MNKKSENNQKIQQRIQVFARCRPLNNNERKQGSPSVVEIIPDKKIVVKDRNVNREFLFDRVFSPDTKQISVYKAVVEPLIKEVLMGYNCTVFAYGQTGTGKTFTMEGERSNSKCSWEEDPGAGIIPRSLHQLFEDLNKEENVEFSVRVSFIELYNEELFDLLSPTELSRLRLFEDATRKGSVIIQGLEDVVVNTKDEVYSILEKGTARRQTAATMLNASSSRSHTVFSVTVHIKENTIEGEELLKTGKLNLVDLAGSENVGRSGAVDKRAREAGNINQSLLTLGRVITALIEKQPHVPYRESKLTRLLQDSLGGHTKTSIIATISPALCNFDETISTLDYATKAKSITIKPEINQKMTKRALIREYTEEIERLRKDLVALRCKEGFYIDLDNYTNLMAEINEKKDMIRDLLDKIDMLKEENTKVEEMFNVTKKELNETCEKLDETSQKYESTVVKLSNTTEALNYTQKVLTETTLERDEKQFLINIQSDTEKKLSHQAQKLLNIADETTSHVERLHAKIARKDYIEKSNEEKCQEFRTMYQKQFALLDDLVSLSEKQQAANLSSTKADIDNLIQSIQDIQLHTSNFINEFVCLVGSNIEKLSANFASHADSQSNWTHSLFEEINCKKATLSNKQQEFLSEKLSEFMNMIKTRNLELEKWMLSVHEKLSHKIEKELEILNKNSDKRKILHNSVKESLELMCQSYEEILKDFNLQSEAISKEEDSLEKDFSEKIQELKRNISSLEELAERQKGMQKNISCRDNALIKSLEYNGVEMKKIQQPLTTLCNSEEVLKEDINALNEMLSLVDIKEFSEKQSGVHQSQQHVISEFERFLKQHKEEEEKIHVETGNALKNNLTSLSENLQSIQGNIVEANTAVKTYANSEASSFGGQIGEVQKIVYKAEETVKESQDFLISAANKLKDEILKRDIEFEKFISEDLLKDIPTGTTPQRKAYMYPRILAATSPHDRILQRYRSQLAADTAVAIDLPLNSSFSETDELKLTPVSSNCDAEVQNASFSSNDSTACDTDSCASSVSDVSVDNGRNKENKKMSKKKSRLPKRLPSSKVFIKPPPPARKPLVTANPALTEQSGV